MKWHRRILLLFLLFVVATPLLSFFTVPPVKAVDLVNKTVTWGDSTIETIRVDEYGNIYLNGSLGKAFGFMWFGWESKPDSTISNKILDWEVTNNVRFQWANFLVTDSSGNPQTYQLNVDYVDRILNQFYSHKMWTIIILGPQRMHAWDSYTAWYNAVDDFIDYIDNNASWSDMIFAIGLTNEVDDEAQSLGKTATEVGTLLDNMNTRVNTLLGSSPIGSVPIFHRLDGISETEANRQRVVKIVEKSDVIFRDFYAEDTARIDSRLTWDRLRYAEAGKDTSSGYKIWYDMGVTSNGDATLMTPTMFTHLLDKNDTAHINLWFLYEAWDGARTYPSWYFDDDSPNDGDPEYWTELLAPYFPTFAVGGTETPIGWYGWENGFEDGDNTFPEWNDTSTYNGEVSVTTNPVNTGTYSANFTTTSNVSGSYARLQKMFAPQNELFVRCWVRFQALPDTNGRRMAFLGLKNTTATGGGWLASVQILNNTGTIEWRWDILGNIQTNATPTINVNTWYSVELQLNVTTNGFANLWINEVLTLNRTGDLSSGGQIQQVFPGIQCVGGDQIMGKTLFIDDFRVDTERIYSWKPIIFQGTSNVNVHSGLEDVTINGTYTTDSMGFYTWVNLTLNQEYVFTFSKASYYPAWVLNADSFYWNGTQYIVTKNLTQSAIDIQVHFYSSSQQYINNTNAMLTSASMVSNVLYLTGDDSGTKNIEVYSATQPTYVMGKSYNSSMDYVGTTFNMSYTFSGAKTFALSWQDFDGVVVNATTGELSTESTWENQMLTLYITDTGTSTTDVYASSLGEPHWVIGEQSWIFNETSSMIRVVVAHSSEEEVEVSWAREKWLFTFKGLYDEDSGSYLSSVDVTAYYVNLTSTTFTVNGTHYFSSEYEPLYFLFTLTPYDRDYWIHTGENDTTIYIFNASTSVYTFAFLDLADALDYPYVEAKYYVNGTLQTVEKRRVDMENKIQMSLVEGKKYSIVILGNTTHTYGDLLMTSTTTVQLPIKGIELPEDILPISEKVWIYGNRTFDSPNDSISIVYQDEMNQTNSVKIYVNYKNGTNAYNETETANSFIHTWSSALNNTDYMTVVIVDHALYGIITWKQPLPYHILGTPSNTSFFGTIVQFVTSIIISSFIILAIVVRTGVLKRDMFMHASDLIRRT